jgi:uncharacterized protein
MLKDLFVIHNRIVQNTPIIFKRFLFNRINWNNRLIVIVGARGTGKSTLVLQHFHEKYNDIEKCLYLLADNPLVIKDGIYNTVAEYFKYYGECVIIDEVHKFSNWSEEVKALYDAYPDKNFIILGSSALNILGEKGDLSRRGIIYKLPYLSFREYISLKYNIEYKESSFSEIINNHLSLSQKIVKNSDKILSIFQDYLSSGNFPFFINHTENEYFNIISNIIDKVVYEDIPSIHPIDSSSTQKIKKLLGFLALSKIPLFNVESSKIGIGCSKETLYDYFDLLERAEIISIIKTQSKNVRVIKNSKILFKGTNYYHALAYEMWKNDLEKGNIRESFFASQILKDDYKLYTSDNVDFTIIDKQGQSYEIEVGGISKKKKQIETLPNGYIFKDGIELGFGEPIKTSV